MENEIVNMRIIPYVRTVIKVKNGKERLEKIDNLSSAEISKMSVKIPKIFEKNSDGVYVLDETSLTFRGTGLRMLLAFEYDELTDEEKIKYFDRSIVVPVIKKNPQLVRTPSNKTRKRVRSKKVD